MKSYKNSKLFVFWLMLMIFLSILSVSIYAQGNSEMPIYTENVIVDSVNDNFEKKTTVPGELHAEEFLTASITKSSVAVIPDGLFAIWYD